jgi:hypothetical protein
LRTRGAFEHLEQMPGNVAIRQPGALQACLVSAGFADAREVVEQVDLAYPDAETWWASLWTYGSRRALEALTSEQLIEVRTLCLEAHASWPDRMACPSYTSSCS